MCRGNFMLYHAISSFFFEIRAWRFSPNCSGAAQTKLRDSSADHNPHNPSENGGPSTSTASILIHPRHIPKHFTPHSPPRFPLPSLITKLQLIHLHPLNHPHIHRHHIPAPRSKPPYTWTPDPAADYCHKSHRTYARFRLGPNQ